MNRKESPIFTRSYDFLNWLLPATLKFPRQHRFVMAEAIQRAAFGFQERLIEAAYAENPKAALARADVDLAKVRFYLRLARDQQLISIGQYQHAARMLAEIGRLLGGWRTKIESKLPQRQPGQ